MEGGPLCATCAFRARARSAGTRLAKTGAGRPFRGRDGRAWMRRRNNGGDDGGVGTARHRLQAGDAVVFPDGRGLSRTAGARRLLHRVYRIDTAADAVADGYGGLAGDLRR